MLKFSTEVAAGIGFGVIGGGHLTTFADTTSPVTEMTVSKNILAQKDSVAIKLTDSISDSGSISSEDSKIINKSSLPGNLEMLGETAAVEVSQYGSGATVTAEVGRHGTTFSWIVFAPLFNLVTPMQLILQIKVGGN